MKITYYFFFSHTLSSQVLQGTDWILGSLVARTTTRDSNATPLLRIYIKTTKKELYDLKFSITMDTNKYCPQPNIILGLSDT